MLASTTASGPSGATASRQPRTHRRALTLAAKASLSPRGGATSGTSTSEPPHAAPHAPQLLLQPASTSSTTTCHAAPAAAPAAAEASLLLQGTPQPALLVPARRRSLVQTIKSHRKQLEQQRRPCPPTGFVQDDARGAEAAVVGQLLLELRRIELHQVAPHGDGCTTLPLPPRPAAAVAAVQQQPAAVRLRALIDGDGEEDPWEAGLDLSSELFAPRSYPVAGRVLVCQGSKCRAKGALGVLQAVSAVASGADSAVQVLPCKCLGKCKEGAVVRVKQDGVAKCAVYTQLEPAHVPGILDGHFLQPTAAPEPVVADACCTDCRTTAPEKVSVA